MQISGLLLFKNVREWTQPELVNLVFKFTKPRVQIPYVHKLEVNLAPFDVYLVLTLEDDLDCTFLDPNHIVIDLLSHPEFELAGTVLDYNILQFLPFPGKVSSFLIIVAD